MTNFGMYLEDVNHWIYVKPYWGDFKTEEDMEVIKSLGYYPSIPLALISLFDPIRGELNSYTNMPYIEKVQNCVVIADWIYRTYLLPYKITSKSITIDAKIVSEKEVVARTKDGPSFMGESPSFVKECRTYIHTKGMGSVKDVYIEVMDEDLKNNYETPCLITIRLVV